MSFGDQLKKRREELGLSRSELADRLGVSRSAVGNYETGVSAPKEEVLLRLFDALHVEPNYLYRDAYRGGIARCSRGAIQRDDTGRRLRGGGLQLLLHGPQRIRHGVEGLAPGEAQPSVLLQQVPLLVADPLSPAPVGIPRHRLAAVSIFRIEIMYQLMAVILLIV